MFDATTLLGVTNYKERDGTPTRLEDHITDRMVTRVRDAIGTVPGTLDTLADAYVQDRALVEASLFTEIFAAQGALLRQVYAQGHIPPQMTDLILNTLSNQDNAALDRALAVHLLEQVLPRAAKLHKKLILDAYTSGTPSVRDKLAGGAKGYRDLGVKDGWVYGRAVAYFDGLLGIPQEKKADTPTEPEPLARWTG